MAPLGNAARAEAGQTPARLRAECRLVERSTLEDRSSVAQKGSPLARCLRSSSSDLLADAVNLAACRRTMSSGSKQDSTPAT